MKKLLRYISISHKTASVVQREVYHIPEEEKEKLVSMIRATFSDITGLLLLVTCNRTEIYFESVDTTSGALRDFLISETVGKGNTSEQLFSCGDTTEATVKHLLKVSSGLDSSVLGDVEIIHQIKKAYQFSIGFNLQGSLLERAMQTVFKSHKRISNETLFRDGTTSVAYKALKMITHTYDKSSAKEKKILFIGAGDIVKQLFKYNSKFSFTNIYVGNRTEAKAITLAKKYQAKVYSWEKVLANDFMDFDVIIGAASNCADLVKRIPAPGKDPVLLIDLAVPCNINKNLSRKENVLLYDLDTISMDLEDTKEKRTAAIGKVKEIIQEEHLVYTQWLQRAPLRAFLAEYKIFVNQKVIDYLETDSEEYDLQTVKTVTDRVIRRVKRRTNPAMSLEEMDAVIAEQVSFL